jgi:hypothetical protein
MASKKGLIKSRLHYFGCAIGFMGLLILVQGIEDPPVGTKVIEVLLWAMMSACLIVSVSKIVRGDE